MTTFEIYAIIKENIKRKQTSYCDQLILFITERRPTGPSLLFRCGKASMNELTILLFLCKFISLHSHRTAQVAPDNMNRYAVSAKIHLHTVIETL